MNMKSQKIYLIVFALIISAGFSLADNNMINQIVERLIAYSNSNYQEKVYVQTDSDLYYAGDIVWLSTRLLDAQSHTPSKLSKVVHIKLLDRQENELHHKKIKIEEGLGQADIILSDTLSTGYYHIIGYTEWMKNFAQEFFFQKSIRVVNQKPEIEDQKEKDDERLSVRFFPEGGSFIEEMNNRLGIEIKDQNGIGVNQKGFIVDNKGDTVVNVNTFKFGLGSFFLKPKKGRTYALHIDHNDHILEFPLPIPQEDGLNLTVDPYPSDRIHLELEASRKFISQNAKIYLIVHSRGSINFAAEGGTSKKYLVNIPKERLDDGVNHLTIFNDEGMPLLERLIFIQPGNAPNLMVSGIRRSYQQREMVRLDLTTELEGGANVTISVHDRPSLNTDNIENYLLLSSDLKGSIVHPEYYFMPHDSALVAADNLMLTQGWRRFVWKEIFKETPTKFRYPAESDGLVFRGKLIDTQSGEAIRDTAILVSFLDQAPNYLTAYVDSGGEFACVLHELYGKKMLFSNVPGEGDSERFQLLPTYVYDTFKVNIPNNLQSMRQLPLSNHLDNRYKEKLIRDNYRIHMPELYSVPAYQVDKDVFRYNQKLYYPNKEIYTDDYVQLSSLEELVFELIPTAKFKKSKGKEQLYVFNESTKTSVRSGTAYDHSEYVLNTQPATIFVNGVPLFDQEEALQIPYSNIHKVEIYNSQKHNYSGHTFHGVVAIVTKDFLTGQNTGSLKTLNSTEVQGYEFKREYYAPIGTDEPHHDRIPDIRHLLFWKPSTFVTTGDATTLTFNTSDVKGDFVINVEGVSTSGKPIYWTSRFSVE
jgi:hypothetical protein